MVKLLIFGVQTSAFDRNLTAKADFQVKQTKFRLYDRIFFIAFAIY